MYSVYFLHYLPSPYDKKLNTLIQIQEVRIQITRKKLQCCSRININWLWNQILIFWKSFNSNIQLTFIHKWYLWNWLQLKTWTYKILKITFSLNFSEKDFFRFWLFDCWFIECIKKSKKEIVLIGSQFRAHNLSCTISKWFRNPFFYDFVSQNVPWKLKLKSQQPNSY